MEEGKFEVSDLVVYKGNFAKVTDCLGPNYLGSRQYKIIFKHYKKGDPESIIVNEYELKFAEDCDIILKGKKKGQCDCGAWTTKNNNLHADWCTENKFRIGI